ncbi:hypothetical protein FKP32DRAFT_1601207 [Trametes sanguinea]|nr:hypothetical protein FKP32DRAFT_1601207 [Trametes sanguinea]
MFRASSSTLVQELALQTEVAYDPKASPRHAVALPVGRFALESATREQHATHPHFTTCSQLTLRSSRFVGRAVSVMIISVPLSTDAKYNSPILPSSAMSGDEIRYIRPVAGVSPIFPILGRCVATKWQSAKQDFERRRSARKASKGVDHIESEPEVITRGKEATSNASWQ